MKAFRIESDWWAWHCIVASCLLVFEMLKCIASSYTNDNHRERIKMIVTERCWEKKENHSLICYNNTKRAIDGLSFNWAWSKIEWNVNKFLAYPYSNNKHQTAYDFRSNSFMIECMLFVMQIPNNEALINFYVNFGLFNVCNEYFLSSFLDLPCPTENAQRYRKTKISNK